MKVTPSLEAIQSYEILAGPYNYITAITKQIAEQYNKKKLDIILERIKELNLGEDFDMLKEQQRLFPRFKIVSDGLHQKELLYYNDGSECGKLILEIDNVTHYPYDDLTKTGVSVEMKFKKHY